MPFSKENAAQMGRKGGNATKAKHGREHFSKAGKAGVQAHIDKHFDGDREKFNEWLASVGRETYGRNYAEMGFTPKMADGVSIWQAIPHPSHVPEVYSDLIHPEGQA